jgi:hypothetical protein
LCTLSFHFTVAQTRLPQPPGKTALGPRVPCEHHGERSRDPLHGDLGETGVCGLGAVQGNFWLMGESVTGGSGRGLLGCGGAWPSSSTGEVLAFVLPVQGILGGSERHRAKSAADQWTSAPTLSCLRQTHTAAAVLGHNRLASLRFDRKRVQLYNISVVEPPSQIRLPNQDLR